MKREEILRSGQRVRERRAGSKTPGVSEAKRTVVDETGLGKFVPSIRHIHAKMMLSDPIDVLAYDRLELLFLQDQTIQRRRGCEARVKTYFPTVPGQGDDSRGKVRVLEVREAPSENAIPKALLGLRPFLEHEKSGAQPCGT